MTCDVKERNDISTNTSQPGWGRLGRDLSLILRYGVAERNSGLEWNGGLKRRLTASFFNWNKDAGRNNAIPSNYVVFNKAVEMVSLL